MIINRVLFTLVVAGVLSAAFLPLAAIAPNRLVLGQPVGLLAALGPWPTAIALALGLLLLAAALRRPFRRDVAHWVVLAASLALLVLILSSTGTLADRVATPEAPATRTSLGAAFWTLIFCIGLAAMDALQRLRAGLAVRVAYIGALVLAVTVLFATSTFDQLSIMREYANRRDVFAAEFATHLFLVAAALIPALLIGVPLGLTAVRWSKLRGGLFGTLNFLQTIPSIALFGLLVAPLSALADAVPTLRAMGIQGIGAAPAIIALIMYSLLPIVRNTYAGIAGIPANTVEAATGMGMTQRQILWRVQIPLALPVLLSGLRIVTVQAIGLTAVAALIGAGGLGAFVFQGLGQYAIDLVLLGAIPTIFLAVTADFVLQVLVSVTRTKGMP